MKREFIVTNVKRTKFGNCRLTFEFKEEDMPLIDETAYRAWWADGTPLEWTDPVIFQNENQNPTLPE
jgi:hypothetical protein